MKKTWVAKGELRSILLHVQVPLYMGSKKIKELALIEWLVLSQFGVELEQLPDTIMLVEGAFDRLTLVAAGLPASQIVALVGTALQVEWLPVQVKTVVLALDGDDGGKEASSRLADQLAQAGLRVQVCPSGQTTWGKDWNELWQHLGQQSLAPVFEILSESRSA